MNAMYLPTWQGLALRDLLPSRTVRPLPFPLGAGQAVAFYRARTAIYHLFQALGLGPDQFVLAPDYHSGSEIRAIRATGARVRLYPIDRSLRPDMDALDRLSRSGARVLFVIHYLGWAQPIEQLRDLCARRGMVLVEDCALSLLSAHRGRPLGSFGDYSIFCLYKTLPVPNGGLLVRNNVHLPVVAAPPLRDCGSRPILGRTTELLLDRLRSRSERIGGLLSRTKRTMGRLLDRAGVAAHPVGDIGFNERDLLFAMSPLCERLLGRFDHEAIVRVRRRNFARLRSALPDMPNVLFDDLPEGVCPLFFPLLVRDKNAAARALRARGIEAIEFWNDAGPEPDSRPETMFLRRHVLELPIHQDLTESHIDYLAEAINGMKPLFAFDGDRSRRCAV